MTTYSLCIPATATENITGSNGFGNATLGMIKSLKRLGYQIEPNDASADVEIAFNQPQLINWTKEGQYRVIFVPWESTELISGWLEIMNAADEVWTPSALTAQWFKDAGVTKPVFVYEHGLDHEWSPVLRKPEEKIKFLMVGAESTRKGGWDTVRHFRRAFPNRTDVSLTLKMINSSWNTIPSLGKVTYINERYSFEQLQSLFYDHHVYSYFSSGEGFGLTPLQAIGSGMPTITVPAWAPYRDLLDPRLCINSELVKSSWPKIHPGNIFRPNADDSIDHMRYAVDNWDSVNDFAFNTAPAVHEKYNWDTITSKVFTDLENRLKTLPNASL